MISTLQLLIGFLSPARRKAAFPRSQGITGAQLKTWRLEIEAFGLAETKRRQKADAAELAQLRKENKKLVQEVEILHKASAFFRDRGGGTMNVRRQGFLEPMVA
jgi:transposase